MNHSSQNAVTPVRQRSQYVITDTVETSGAVCYWRLSSEVKLDVLASAWRAAGLDEKLLPAPPKDEVALGRAVADQAAHRRLVRPLARRGAWAIVDETVVEGQAPTYRTMLTASFANGLMQPPYQVDATSIEFRALCDGIHNAYTAHRNTLAHNDVSSWLLDIAHGQKAVSLRDSGGVYFIPRDAVDYWNCVANAVERGGAGTVFRIPAMKTAEAVAAITDAITAEAAALAQKIEDEIMATGDDALGVRALKTRVASAVELLTKIGSYEELIGKQLEIRQRIELLSANVSALALTSETAENT